MRGSHSKGKMRTHGTQMELSFRIRAFKTHKPLLKPGKIPPTIRPLTGTRASEALEELLPIFKPEVSPAHLSEPASEERVFGLGNVEIRRISTDSPFSNKVRELFSKYYYYCRNKGCGLKKKEITEEYLRKMISTKKGEKYDWETTKGGLYTQEAIDEIVDRIQLILNWLYILIDLLHLHRISEQYGTGLALDFVGFLSRRSRRSRHLKVLFEDRDFALLVSAMGSTNEGKRAEIEKIVSEHESEEILALARWEHAVAAVKEMAQFKGRRKRKARQFSEISGNWDVLICVDVPTQIQIDDLKKRAREIVILVNLNSYESTEAWNISI